MTLVTYIKNKYRESKEPGVHFNH